MSTSSIVAPSLKFYIAMLWAWSQCKRSVRLLSDRSTSLASNGPLQHESWGDACCRSATQNMQPDTNLRAHTHSPRTGFSPSPRSHHQQMSLPDFLRAGTRSLAHRGKSSSAMLSMLMHRHVPTYSSPPVGEALAKLGAFILSSRTASTAPWHVIIVIWVDR